MRWRVVYLNEVDSTNEYAKRLIPNVSEGTVIVARKQTAGRGRKGRVWASPEGGLWVSVILKPPRVDPRLVFVGALAVANTLGDFGINGWIKWPNDVWVEEKKISGILTEVKGGFLIMGIGINVNNEVPKELREKATSMRNVLGKPVDVGAVLEKLLEHLDEWYRTFLENPLRVVEEIRGRTLLVGREVRVLQDGDELIGRVMNISDDGSLILDVDDRIIRVVYGDVSIRIKR